MRKYTEEALEKNVQDVKEIDCKRTVYRTIKDIARGAQIAVVTWHCASKKDKWDGTFTKADAIVTGVGIGLEGLAQYASAKEMKHEKELRGSIVVRGMIIGIDGGMDILEDTIKKHQNDNVVKEKNTAAEEEKEGV